MRQIPQRLLPCRLVKLKTSEQSHKFTFRFKDKKVVFNKAPSDPDFYPFAKALAYALYHKKYPTIRVEAKVDERFQPDLNAFSYDGTMIFWAEVGSVSINKIEKLFKKYRQTHFVFVKEEKDVANFTKQLDKLAKDASALPLVDIVVYPEHFAEWNVSEEGDVFVDKKDVTIISWHEPEGMVKQY